MRVQDDLLDGYIALPVRVGARYNRLWEVSVCNRSRE